MENWKIQQLEAKPDNTTEAKTDDMETEEQPLTQPRGETFVDELTEEVIIPKSINGIMASKEPEDHFQPVVYLNSNNTVAPFLHPQPNISNRKSLHKGFGGRQQVVKGYEWIEMGVRRQQLGIHTEEEERMREFAVTNERRVSWNHRVQGGPHLNHSVAVDPFRFNTYGPYAVLPGGYPDVDYPTDEDTSLQPPNQQTVSTEGSEFLRKSAEGATWTKRDLDSQPLNQDTRRNFSHSQSGDMEASPEVWAFSRNLKSPGLRRRRPVSTHQVPLTQRSRQVIQGSGPAWSASFSNSEYNQSFKRNSVPPGHGSDSHRVLKLGSLKPNQGMFWNMHDRLSPDPQTLSEPEQPDFNFYNKRPKMKTQRSASIPNIIIEGGHGLHLHSSSLYTLPQERDTQFAISGHNPNGYLSPLEGLLERAKGRGRDRDGLMRDRNLRMTNLKYRYPPPSPSFSNTSSPSPSDGDRDTEWEEEVELMRHRAPTVSKGWKEQLVDGDDDERRHRSV